MSLSYIFILCFVGYGNFKRIGVFYFMPTQSSNAPYHYLSEPIMSKGMKISNIEASLKIKKDADCILLSRYD